MRRAGLPAVLTGFLLAGCSTAGDFGRPAPSVFDDLLSSAGTVSAAARGEAASWFHLTDDEQRLRDRAWRLVMPSHERNHVERLISDFAHRRILPAEAQSGAVADYHRALVGGSYASQASRYNRLADDALSDRQLIGEFHATALRVIAADRARLRTMEASPRIAPERRDPAYDRVVENEGVMLWVCERMGFRLASYRYALDNLVVEMPSRDAVRAERAIMALEAAIGPACRLPLIGVFREGGTGRSERPVSYKG